MKKVFTLLTLALMAIGSAWAGDVFTYTLNGGKAISDPEGFFSYDTSGKFSFHDKFKGAEYDGVQYSNGLKMEGSTKILWTSTAESEVIIVQSSWSDKTIKFDGKELSDRESGTGCYVYTLSNVAPGEHNITRGSGESGLFLVKVTYTGSVMQQLDAPEISFDTNTGIVTISSVDNAVKVTYTTDGTNPTEDSEEYTEPFTVEDGTTVKAIAIGDNVSYINSTISSEIVVLANAEVVNPVIKQFNGTVAISTETFGATIEYSLDGSSYQVYTRPFTLTEDGTVYAKASRNGKESEVVQESISTIGKGDANKTIWMGLGSFTDNNKNVMTGAEGDDAEGIVLAITGNTEKNWSGSDKITIGDIERTSIKLSNGAQNTMTLPEGMEATRITFYSYINSAEARTSYWKEFNGQEISADVPMGAWNTVEDRLTNPDVRVFPLSGESSFTFTNAGEQLCFIIALDVVDATADDPKLKLNASEVNLAAVPLYPKATATVTLTGVNIPDGDYTVSLPSIDGLSIEPTSFTAKEGKVNQEFTITYTSTADMDKKEGVISFDGGTTVDLTVVVSSRSTRYEQETVRSDAKWDWTGLKEEVDLKKLSEDVQKAETLMAEFETQINFVESFGDPYAISVKGMQYPSRKGFAQGSGSINIITNVPGTVTIEYSNTGDNNNRWLTVNGAQFGDEAVGTTKRTATSPVVPAGLVSIKGTGALRYYTIEFTPADAPTAITAEITDAGYATFSSLFEVAIGDLTAYTATEVNENTVTLTAIEGNVIPAGTGVVLKGSAGSHSLEVTATGAAIEGKNLLKANLSEVTPADETYYTLAAGPKFMKSSGGVLGEGKAYLVLPKASEARSLNIVFNDATGIKTVDGLKAAADGTVFNLNGQRVVKAAKGLYIQNGKKMLVK